MANPKQDWFQARAEIRITEAVFNFKTLGSFTVSGYIDLLGPEGNEHITSKEFTHSFYAHDEEFGVLHKLLVKKCGEDLFGQRRGAK